MFSVLTPEELAGALDAVAEQTLETAGISGPPVDAFHLAEALGIVVAWDEQQRVRARYVRLVSAFSAGPRPTVLLRPDGRPERRNWALAHEIGEHLAWQVFERLGMELVEAGQAAREMVANQLAGRLLVPTPWFRQDAAGCAWDLLALKARYATASHEAIARRMLDAGPPAIITVFDQGEVFWRLSNVPGRVPRLAQVELRCWRKCHAENRAVQLEDDQLSVRAWPVHEDHWRREIVRTAIEVESQW